MPLSALQQEAFALSPDFNRQVNAIVRETARYRLKPPAPPNPTPATQQVYVNVIRNPAAYQFVEAVISDAGWAITYDTWSADPGGYSTAIEAGVQAIWYEYLQVPEPVPEP